MEKQSALFRRTTFYKSSRFHRGNHFLMKFRLNRVGKSECVNWPKPASTKVKHECMFAQSKNKIIIIKMEKYKTKVYSLRRRDQRRLHNTKGIKLSSFLRSYKSLELYDLTSKLKLWNISRFNAFHNKRRAYETCSFGLKRAKDELKVALTCKESLLYSSTSNEVFF